MDVGCTVVWYYGYSANKISQLVLGVFQILKMKFIGWIFVSPKYYRVLTGLKRVSLLDRLIYRLFCTKSIVSYYLCTTWRLAIVLVIISNLSIFNIQMRWALRLRSAWGDVIRICIEKILSTVIVGQRQHWSLWDNFIYTLYIPGI